MLIMRKVRRRSGGRIFQMAEQIGKIRTSVMYMRKQMGTVWLEISRENEVGKGRRCCIMKDLRSHKKKFRFYEKLETSGVSCEQSRERLLSMF